MNQQMADKIHTYFSKFPKRTYDKGQILVFADETPEHIFYITEGKVRQYDVSYRGDEVIVNVFTPPAFFPMSWAINRTENQYFYKTEETTEVYVVPVDAVLEFIKSDPEVLFDLLSRVYIGIDGLLGRVVHLMSGTAKSRLMYELIIECRRFGEKQTDGSFVLRTNEVDIAARSGLSRETVSREIRKIQTNGLVSVVRGGMIVNDLAALEALHGAEI